MAKAGILYPGRSLNHNFLIALGRPADQLPRIFRQHYAGDESRLRADFDAFIGEIRQEIDAVTPHTVVMSGENLWHARNNEADRHRQLLASLATDVTIVAYVRRPADYYLSMIQQGMKASHQISRLRPIEYRNTIETLAGFGAKLEVHEYDVGSFPDGDISLDFARRYAPEAAGPLKKVTLRKRTNESMSAELMEIAREYRAHTHESQPNVFTKETKVLLRTLRNLDSGRRPKLKPEIADTLNHGAPDLLWLRNTHGVTFEGIDYDRIAEIPSSEPERIADICIVDQERKEGLVYEAIHAIVGGMTKDRPDLGYNFTTLFRPGTGGRRQGRGGRKKF
ncbi:hypothetical protein [Bauldia sp.]|uniref:hypothetical protein n=1 Tax=Bauldia sp. TaxID=2575872 RepID=UPI003BAA4B2F